MVDPVIDEHFRRSLGADYMNLFGKRLDQLKSTSSLATTTIKKSSPKTSPIQSNTNGSIQVKEANHQNESSSINRDSVKETVENIELSVDDHFAKALGDTWKQLQQISKPATESNHDSDVNSDAENDSNENDDDTRLSLKSDSVAHSDTSKSPIHR